MPRRSITLLGDFQKTCEAYPSLQPQRPKSILTMLTRRETQKLKQEMQDALNASAPTVVVCALLLLLLLGLSWFGASSEDVTARIAGWGSH